MKELVPDCIAVPLGFGLCCVIGVFTAIFPDFLFADKQVRLFRLIGRLFQIFPDVVARLLARAFGVGLFCVCAFALVEYYGGNGSDTEYDEEYDRALATLESVSKGAGSEEYDPGFTEVTYEAPSEGNAEAQAPAAAAPPSPEAVLAEAEALVQGAGEDWGAERFQDAIQKAEKAKTLYLSLYGEQHAKVIKVQNMIDAANQMLQSSSVPVAGL